jgi:ribosomal protein S20
MTDPRGPNQYGRSEHQGPADPFADSEPDAGVDAILRDDALLDALARGELPAAYRADITARALTNWRDDIDEGLPPLRAADLPSPVLLATPRDNSSDDTDVLFAPLRDLGADDTAQLPLLLNEGASGPDRIDESVRSAFVAAGYARPTEQLPPVRPNDEPTQQFPASFDRLPPADADDAPVTGLSSRRVRRRRFDRVVVATAAVAAVLAAGSAGSVAAAATARPGDTLWPISRVVYAERARSIEASQDAHASLQKARAAAERGDADAAQRYYAEAQQKLDEQVREGSDEADRLAHDLETTAAMPEFPVVPGSPWSSPGAAPSTSSGGSTSTNPSARSRWQRGNPRGGSTAQATPPPPGTTPAPPPTTGGPTDPAPTTGAPNPDPTTQAPEPTPTDGTTSPDPVPSDGPSAESTPEPQTPAEPGADAVPAE